MMDQTTTVINDLPTITSDPHGSRDPHGSSGQSIDEIQIRQLVTGIQEASLKGATRIRTSDIPQDPLQLTVDKEIIQPIEPRIIPEPVIDTGAKSGSLLDWICNVPVDIQIPIVMGVLAGATQLSSVSLYLRETCKWMYTDAGYLSWVGWIAYIIVFGIVWYIVGYVLRKLAR
jgi:hypothetical protein